MTGETETVDVRMKTVCGFELARVVFGIGNSLVLFGRKRHCAELVHIQRRATPTRRLMVNGRWEVPIVLDRIGSHSP